MVNNCLDLISLGIIFPDNLIIKRVRYKVIPIGIKYNNSSNKIIS